MTYRNDSHPAPLTVLRVDASGRAAGSVSRQLGDLLIAGLEARRGALNLIHRDVAAGLPFVDEAWIGANFTPAEEHDEAQRTVLAQSDALVEELKAADVVVIGVPMYNFGIPATLKAWVDMVARARLTFRYTDNGPVGMLEGKKAYLLVASGGTPVGSDIDFASSYMRHVLGFLGITDVEVIAADRLMMRGEEGVAAARERIEAVLDANEPARALAV